jgi:cell surface protein SprA
VRKDIYPKGQCRNSVAPLLNLDRLNNQLDPQPDGVFDYLEGFTVVSNRAQIIFPCWNHSAMTLIQLSAAVRSR